MGVKLRRASKHRLESDDVRVDSGAFDFAGLLEIGMYEGFGKVVDDKTWEKMNKTACD